MPFGWSPFSKNLPFLLQMYIKPSYHKYRLGSLKQPQVIRQLNKLHKTKTHPSTYLEKFHTILLHHPDHQYIFTDGSKDNNKTSAAVFNKTIHKKALPMKSSIFTAEAYATDLALNIISRDKYNKFIILFDSLSVVTSLKNKKLESPLIVKLLSRVHSMYSHKRWFCVRF